ncbi:hypothetical protein [Saliphagus sp. LR7]|uniref:hypothetical protein n=1 Tax=Saliphagus sp. LR7 TaxID=2282654 RepID=UPI001300B0EC|nr:hypothetical protein [Saliphagus sp. LR7]
MVEDDSPDETENRQSEKSLEERIEALEQQNQELETKLEQQESSGANMTRRGALGVLGGGALLGAAGSANAQERGRGGGPPWEQLLDDTDNDGLLETPNHDGFDVSNYVHNPEDKKWRAQRRQLVTNSGTHLWIDPDGDDENEGSEDAPLATLEEAFSRMPFIIQHEFIIHINEGVHDNEENTAIQSPRSIVATKDDPDFRIIGDPENPEDYILKGPEYISFGLMGAQPLYNITIEGVTLEAVIQNYKGTLGIHKCILHGGPEDSDRSRCVGGYQGDTIVHDCEIGGGVNHFAAVEQFGTLAFGACSGEVQDSIIFGWDYGGICYDLGDNEITAPEWALQDDLTMLTIRGPGPKEIGETDNWWEP